MKEENILYQAQTLAFAKVGVDFLKLVEQEQDKKTFILESLKLLPSLYTQIICLPEQEYFEGFDFVPEYVSEEGYERVQSRIKALLGKHDRFLTTLGQEEQYSDTPVVAYVSEGLADTYQNVGNLLGIIKDQNEEALPLAFGRCKLYLKEYFGRQMLSALSALHELYTSEDFDTLSSEEEEGKEDDNFFITND